jgi:hypothetical protein
MFGPIGASLETADEHPRIAGVMFAAMMGFALYAVVADTKARDAQRAAYEAGLQMWLDECRGAGRQIDDCTSAWSRDGLLQSLYVKS